jgi:hypothetical protein
MQLLQLLSRLLLLLLRLIRTRCKTPTPKP